MGKFMNIMIYSNIFILIMWLAIAGIGHFTGQKQGNETCLGAGGSCGTGTQCIDENAFNPDEPLPSEASDRLGFNCSVSGQICCPYGTIAK